MRVSKQRVLTNKKHVLLHHPAKHLTDQGHTQDGLVTAVIVKRKKPSAALMILKGLCYLRDITCLVVLNFKHYFHVYIS